MAGGGKESPRQKMIGMMYLVLTALLAMNVSKDILMGFVTVNESLERTNKNFGENTVKVMDAFNKAKESNPSAAPFYTKAVEMRKLTTEIDEYIKKLKIHVVVETEKLENKAAGDTLRLRYVDKKDNYDDPTHIMIGDDETKPKDGEFTAVELKTKITSVHDKLLQTLDAMQKDPKTKMLPEDFESLKKKIGTIKPVNPTETEDGVPVTWEIQNFYHLPLAAVVTNLSKIQADIKNVEAELVSQLSGAAGKVAIKFNQLAAKVVAPSNYIQSGQQYKADIFLAASSSDFKDENMQVLMGAVYDSVNKKLISEGTPLPLVNGMGQYSAGAGGQGAQTYKGVIKFKKPTGEYDYYPFNGEYMVAAPAAAISADQMNVFYIGVPNPVSVSAAGMSPSELQISANGGGASYTSKGPGKYEFKFTTPGECTISVSAKTKDGVRPQGSQKFRVKPLPKPEARIQGKFSPSEMKKSDMVAVGAIGAGASGFDFAANYIVLSHELVGKVGGKIIPASGNGPNLQGEALKIFKGADVGSKVYIDLKVKGPDGRINQTSCAIKVTK